MVNLPWESKLFLSSHTFQTYQWGFSSRYHKDRTKHVYEIPVNKNGNDIQQIQGHGCSFIEANLKRLMLENSVLLFLAIYINYDYTRLVFISRKNFKVDKDTNKRGLFHNYAKRSNYKSQVSYCCVKDKITVLTSTSSNI